MQYLVCEIILTSALIVDTRLVAWTSVITAAPNVAHTIVAYLIRNAVIIAVAYRFTNAAVAQFIAQTICITKKI